MLKSLITDQQLCNIAEGFKKFLFVLHPAKLIKFSHQAQPSIEKPIEFFRYYPFNPQTVPERYGSSANSSNSTNLFYDNSTGTPIGNYWQDLFDNNLRIYDTDGDGYGDAGPDYPYNSSNGGNVTGYVQDFGPETNPNTAPSIQKDITLEYNLNHTINATAAAYDVDPLTPGVNVSLGTCTVMNYTNSSDGPSFLMRLEGNLSNDPDGNGIESFIYIPYFEPFPWFSKEDRTVIDYLYFDGDDPGSHQVPGMWSWFWIDTPHDSKYGT